MNVRTRPILVYAMSAVLVDPYKTVWGGSGKFRFASGDFCNADIVIPRAHLARYEKFARGNERKETETWKAERECNARSFFEAMRTTIPVNYKVAAIEAARQYGAGLTLTIADLENGDNKGGHKLPPGGSEANAMNALMFLRSQEAYKGRDIKMVLCSKFDRLLPLACDEHGVEYIDIPQPLFASRYQGLVTAYVEDGVFHEASGRGDFGIYPNAFQIYDEYSQQMTGLGRFFHNEYVTITSMSGATLLGRFDGQKVVPLHTKGKLFGAVSAKGVRQQCLVDALIRPELDRRVIVEGFAGTGKTLLALAAAYDARRAGRVKNIMVFHPNTSLADKEGFLPGSWQRKTDHYHKSLYQKVAKIAEMRRDEKGMSGTMSGDPVEQGRHLSSDVNSEYYLQIEMIHDERGTEYEDTFIILDESQNYTELQLRSVMARTGRGCLTVSLGDVTQGDNEKNSEYHNGLMQAVMHLFDRPLTTILRLTDEKGVFRSESGKELVAYWK